MSFLKRITIIAAVASCALGLALDGRAQGKAEPSGWSTHRGDFYGTGQSGDATDATEGLIHWTFLASERISHAPLVMDGVLYVGDWAGIAYALDARTGRKLWNTSPRRRVDPEAALPEEGTNPLDAKSEQHPYKFSGFGLDGQRLYGATHTGIVTAFSRQDGAVVWERDFETEIYSSLRIADGKLLFGAGDGRFRALDVATGEDVWSYEAGDLVGATCAILKSGTVVFPSHDKFLHLIDLADGKLKRRFDLGYRSTGSPLVAFGCAYFCSTGRRFNCVDLVDGKVLWHAPSSTPHQQGIGLWKDRVMVHIGPHLVCYRAVDGEELWRVRLESDGSVSPCVGTTLIYHSDKSGMAYAIDPATGKERWRVDFGKDAWSSPVLAGGLLFVCDGIGRVRAIK